MINRLTIMNTIKNLSLQSLLFLLSCCKPLVGAKKTVFQERIIPAYSQIKVLGNADIILTEGNVGQITVETSEKNHYLCSLMGTHHYDYCNIDINN